MRSKRQAQSMPDTLNLSLRCRYPRELPEGRFTPRWRRIPAMITCRSDRTPFLFLAELFELINGPSAKLERFEARSDFMGGLKARMELAGDVARLAFDYEQSIDDDWQHVDRQVFIPSFETHGTAGLSFDIDLSGSGEVEFNLTNAEMRLVEKAMSLAAECFSETVLGPGMADELRIKSLLAQAAWEKRRPAAGNEHGAAENSKNGVEGLAQALDRERDAYMEWHDGPDFSEEAEAVARLEGDELKMAGEMIAARLEAGYDVHLGRSAVMLGLRGDRMPQMVTALESALRREKRAYLRARLASDVLRLIGSAPAQMALRQAIADGAGWSEKVDAICCLKELVECRPPDKKIREILTPETAEVLLAGIKSEYYLVRYHAADTLLKAAGEKGGISGNKVLYRPICGSGRDEGTAPGADDRREFEKAADGIREMLKDSGIM